ICLMTLTVFGALSGRAQDAATQAQLDKITGQMQDIEDSLNSQNKRISALETKIAALEEKLNAPAANNYASADDLKQLAEQVQEIDRKRQADNQRILAVLEKLGKSGGFRHPAPDNSGDLTAAPAQAGPAGNNGGPQNGFEYTIAPGNTLTEIVKAYRAQGVKVTVGQVLKANPGLNPNSLIVGKKIFIPAGP
ncbi:MAG: LysM peptidoglycan-binding domain-containing protein, partial [Limisphaerales bacterium]